MNNNMTNVRDQLCKVLAELADPENSPEQVAQTIARAKAMSDVSQTYINSVKVEVDARNLLGVKDLPAAIESPRPKLVGNG